MYARAFKSLRGWPVPEGKGKHFRPTAGAGMGGARDGTFGQWQIVPDFMV